jgi:serine/threonine-protein kinase RsbW
VTVDKTSKEASAVSFRLEARLVMRALAVDMVSLFCEHVAPGDRDFRNAMTTAFGEAFNNIVIHGYRGRSDGILDVEADLSPAHLTLLLKDTGVEADPRSVAPPKLETLPEGGLGVFMIFALVDEVVYRGGRPNVLSLTKRATARGSLVSSSRESESK